MNNSTLVNQKLNIIDKIQKYAIRTYKQLFVHILVIIILAIIVGVLLSNDYIISANSFVVIISSMSAAAGVLLAVSLALATFFSRHLTDWRDRLIYKLKEDQRRIERQMEKSARLHPEISNRLAKLYLKSAFYIPGQAVDLSEIYAADKIFSDWAKEQAKKSTKKFNFGDLKTYDLLEKHLFDAQLNNTELRHTLIELNLVEVAGRAITTFSPLIITWVIITLLTLVFAIIGAMSVLPLFLNIPILLIPFYLFLVAIFALTKDVTAILRHMRIMETGYEQAMADLSSGATPETVEGNRKQTNHD